MTSITGILLAAGGGRRFGGQKLLHSLPGGESVGVAAARNLIAAVPDSVAVVRPGDHELAAALSTTGIRVVENPAAADGMGTSLSVGVGATAGSGGWLVALADMPWIRPETIQALADALRAGAPLVAPVHLGRRGHPVGFSAPWQTKLQALTGDQGARHLLARNASELVLQPTSDPGVLRDVDSPTDLEGSLLERFQEHAAIN